MTIANAIRIADKLKPNTLEFLHKVKCLSQLDGQVFKEVFETHENNPIESFDGYDEASPDDTELLIPYPYAEEVYVNYLKAQIDKENGEIVKYNQSITMYNDAFITFQNWYNRTHMPISKGTRFIF